MLMHGDPWAVPEKFDIDLGHDHYLKFTSWSPDRDLNPQYDGIPDIPRCGAIIWHKAQDGTVCMSGIHFRSEAAIKVFHEKTMWNVESWEPLTCSPSLLCMTCGDHGFIRNNQWEAC